MADMKRIMVTGAVGQIGSELTLALRERYGAEQVLATGHRTKPGDHLLNSGPFEFIDVTRRETLEGVVERYNIDTIFHLSALLSAVGEQHPQTCWDVNVNGLYNVLEIARDRNLLRVFCPSSIAAFGPETPRDHTPQETVMLPKTMYGVTKVSGELLCNYYVQKYGLDVRGVRYPGIISSETLPGGGTTDYAVAIYYEAIKHQKYTCFVRENTVLPMMYMHDCIKAAMDLMEADFAQLVHHADFNVTAMSFTAGALAAEIRKHIPDLKVEYDPDFRQAIADSWPRSLDDSAAREEWGWQPDYDLAAMTVDMLERLGRRYKDGGF